MKDSICLIILAELKLQVENRNPLGTLPPSPHDYCWVPSFVGPIQRSPSVPPTPFFYQPFDMFWDGTGKIWSSNMDHKNPNYTRSGGVASLGEDLSGENLLDRYTSKDGKYNYDYYVSIALEEEFGYDGHDGHDFRTLGATNVSALAAADGEVIEKVDNCKTVYNAYGCYVLIYHRQGPNSLYLNSLRAS